MIKSKPYNIAIAFIVATSICGFGQNNKSTIAGEDDPITEDSIWTIKMFQKEKGNWFSVESDSLYVDFMEEWAWTIRNIRYLGDEIVGEYGAHGSVVRVDTGTGPKDYYYIGTSHGHEIVKNFSIFVDGKEQQYNSGAIYSGKKVIIRKESNLGPFDHIMDITFPDSGNYIIEKHSYKVVEDLNKRFSFLFAFMHELSTAFDFWLAVLPDESELEGDLQKRIQGRISLGRDIKSIIFYSSMNKKGVTLVYPQVYKGADKLKGEIKNGSTEEHFGTSIVDMKIGNSKLYFRPEVKKMGFKVGDTFEYSIKVIPFSAQPKEWETIGKSLAIAGSEALKVVTFGGTVTEGTSAKLDVFHDCFKYGTTTANKVRDTQTWWAISERILRDWVDGGVEVISAGSAGNTVSEGAGRLEDDVLSHSPDYVMVMFGMDDALAGVKTENFKKDLEKIVGRIEEEKVNAVLVTPPPVSERMTINCTMDELRQHQDDLSGLVQVIRDLAEEKSLPLIDFHQYFIDNRLAYDHLFDGWLPDAVAQSAMAPFVAGELLPVMGVNNYPKPILSDYRNVYSDNKRHAGRHNGFTDLAYFQGEFYLALRTGTYHGSGASGEGGGKTIVLRSADGITWVEDGVFQVNGFIDTRDPKFLQIEDRLILYTISWPVVSQPNRTSVVYGFEKLGKGRWSEPVNCASYIFWRPRKWQDKYVVAGYEWNIDEQQKWNFRVVLHQSSNGLDWEKVSTIVDYGTDANETDLFVENDKLMAYSRTEESGNNEMLVSTYIPNENRWETVSSGRMIHAPCVFQAKKRTFIIGRYCSQSDKRFKELQVDWKKFTRYVQQPDEEGYKTVAEATGVDPARIEEYHHGLRTGIFVMDGTKPRLVMELLSAGDSSYSGVVEYGDEYVISDYSMHEYYPVIRKSRDWETPSDIYVSRIRFGN